MTSFSGDVHQVRPGRATSRIAMVFAMWLLPSLAAAQNIVLDSEDRLERASGIFHARRLQLSHGETSLFAAAEDTGAYTFSHPVPISGYYRVYIWWPSYGANDGAAAVTVQHGQGLSTYSWVPNGHHNRWNALGVHWFDESLEASVVVASPRGAPTFVDAIRLEFVGEVEPTLDVVTSAVPLAVQGVSYTAPLEARDGAPPYQWHLFGNVPPGVKVDRMGVLTGTPSETGVYDFEVQAVDSLGGVASRDLRLVVTAPSEDALTADGESIATVDVHSGPAVETAELGDLIETLAPLPEGDWVRVNENLFSDVWSPAELRPLKNNSNPKPEMIILAWSSFAWDSKRGLLIIYGGGHATYPGNDVYFWRGDSRRWERASLPSEITQDDFGNWHAIDGVDAAPVSAHTYDNNIYLPVADRFLTYGGAAFNNGGAYRRQVGSTYRRTGPYSFDPSKAGPLKVGGTTGSHVQRVAPHPEVVGGEMWVNRDIYGLASSARPTNFINGATGYHEEGGKDVVFVSARSGGTGLALYKHTIHDPDNPSLDTFEHVGRFGEGIGDQGAGAYDPILNIFVRTSGDRFTYWDLSTAGPRNKNVLFFPEDLSGSFALDRDFGMDYDPVRHQFVLWRGGGRVWVLRPPEELGPSGWFVEEQPAPTSDVPTDDVSSGVLGKWKYIRNLDVFLALQDGRAGNIWLYKPIGWRPPSPPLPVAITSPADGSTFTEGDDVVIIASASDPDGALVRVEFYEGTTFLGEDTTEPYELTWTNVPLGSYSLTAVAVDDAGGSVVSTPVSISVSPDDRTTVVLQDGVDGYFGTRDAYMSFKLPDARFGFSSELRDRSNQRSLVKFAIFASEGGPIPDGAVIEQATLSLYKFSAYDHRYRLHRLLADWLEGEVTWNEYRGGASWASPGASATGVDFESTHDAEASVGWTAGWLDFEVTAVVQELSLGTPNFGWRLVGISGDNNLKKFASRQSGEITFRPKLMVTYSLSGNLLPSADITSPIDGSTFTEGDDVVITASASDPDGAVVRVEFYEGTTFLGEDTTEPYELTWTNVPLGSYSLTAVAVDDAGGSVVSTPVSISVSPDDRTTVVLQDGVDGYFGTRDAYMSFKLPDARFGFSSELRDRSNQRSLVKFAIFASEGGPIPDGAVIEQATLSLYKISAYDHRYRLHRLLADWLEGEVTWNEYRGGASWASPGASATGVDFESTHDAEASIGWSAGWLDFEVTAAVQELSLGAPNFGWRLVGISGDNNLKKFASRQSGEITFRPKLIVKYSFD